MTNSEYPGDAQAGPFEQFLKQSSIYQAFLEESGAETADDPGAQPVRSAPASDTHGRFCFDLEIQHAHFAMRLDTDDRAHPTATIEFPSRVSRLELNDLHRCVRRVIDAAYPQRGLTPQVALIGNGSEVRLDLARYWDGAIYESALAEQSLSAVIYYLEIRTPLSTNPFSLHGPRQPDFVYGFIPSGIDSREFITISHLQARHIGAELVAAFLQRHRGYVDSDLLADAERLAQQIRDVCKAHAPRTLY